MNVSRNVTLSILLLAAAAAADGQQPPVTETEPGAREESYSERIEVRETQLVVEMPSSFSRRDVRALQPEHLEVLVEGEAYPVTKLERLDEGEGTVVAYVDPELISPETLRLAALALAKRSSALLELGTVGVVMAAPEPRTTLEASPGERQVEEALLDVVRDARRRRDAGGDTEPQAGAERWRTLARWATGASGPPPRVLLLLAEGFPLNAEQRQELGSADGTTESEDLAAAIAEAARALAAGGWSVVSLPIEEGILNREMGGDPITIEGPDGQTSYGIDFVAIYRWLRYGTKPEREIVDERVHEAAVHPALAGLAALAQETAGTVVRYEELLDDALERLGDRWALWFQAPVPEEVAIRGLEVRHKYRDVPLRAPRWLELVPAESPPPE